MNPILPRLRQVILDLFADANSRVAALAVGVLLLAPATSEAQRLRIMPLGDSITSGIDGTDGVGTGGYRTKLEDRLLAAGIPFNFVGNRNNNEGQGGGFIVDTNHQGYGGRSINGSPSGSNNNNLTQELQNGAPLAALSPDIVLLTIGTNNVSWGDAINLTTISADLEALFNELTAQAPTATYVIASIPPTNPNAPIRRAPLSTIESYNSLLEEKVVEWSTEGFDVVFTDIYSALDPVADINPWTPKPDSFTLQPKEDGVHPSTSGYNKMGNTFFGTIQRLYWPVYGLYVTSEESSTSGWRSSPHFGFFYDGDDHEEGWKYHEVLGWIYAPAVKTTSFWIYRNELGWIYTSKDLWPNLYRASKSSWFFLDEERGRLFDYEEEKWNPIPES